MSTPTDIEADDAAATAAKNNVSVDEKNSPPAAVPVKEGGGIRGWLQVIGAFFIFFNIWYEKNHV